MEGYSTRTMTREDVALAVEWAAEEGWNPGLHDAGTFHAADPEGFHAGLLDGRPVASISLVKYGAGFAFLGLYIVRPEARGRGFGWRLWQDAMAGVAGRQVGLDGVVAQQDNYRKSGFSLAWRNVRYEGRGLAQAAAHACVVPLASLPFETVHAYDAPFFPADRAAFLRAWLGQPDAAGFAFVDAGQLRGYGFTRRCRSGWKIGPLLADSEAAADALYVALAGRAGVDEPVYLDLPEPNPGAVALARRHGMQVVFETARMYTGTPPAVPMPRLYGITSFELG
jgi:ribosomal protein S18 acetylase RimI-like enzyme